MALSSIAGRRAVAGLLQRSAAGPAAAGGRARPSPLAAAAASAAQAAHLRGPWARSYSWQGFRAAAPSTSSSSSLLLHLPAGRREERAKQQQQQPLALSRLASHAGMGSVLSQQQQVRALHATRRQENVVVGGLVVAGTALALQYGLRAYNQYKAKKEAEAAAGGGEASSGGGIGGGMSALFAKRFYEGGFEDKMTRREAALILGVRESASAQRIKEAHRRILMLNHPDTGGSTFLASKINEAKEMLLKGK